MSTCSCRNNNPMTIRTVKLAHHLDRDRVEECMASRETGSTVDCAFNLGDEGGESEIILVPATCRLSARACTSASRTSTCASGFALLSSFCL